jgi:hypothetical protein
LDRFLASWLNITRYVGMVSTKRPLLEHPNKSETNQFLFYLRRTDERSNQAVTHDRTHVVVVFDFTSDARA